MLDPFTSFLTEAFGKDEAKALLKAGDTFPHLRDVVFPRAVLAWVACVGERGYNGRVPGTTIETRFQKNEDGYIGTIQLEGHNYEFNTATEHELAATVACAIGVEVQPLSKSLPIDNLQKLGKSLDQMAKAKVLRKAMDAPGAAAPAVKPIVPVKATAAAAPGMGAGKPGKVKLPKPPKLQAGKLPKPAMPKPLDAMPAIKVEKSEWNHPCFRCGGQLLDRGQIGDCFCVAPMRKSLFPEPGPEQSIILKLGPEITRYDLVRLVEIIKVHR